MYHYNNNPAARLKAFAANVGLTLSSPEMTGVGASTVSPKGHAVHKVLQARRLLRCLRSNQQIVICAAILAAIEDAAGCALEEYGVSKMDTRASGRKTPYSTYNPALVAALCDADDDLAIRAHVSVDELVAVLVHNLAEWWEGQGEQH